MPQIVPQPELFVEVRLVQEIEQRLTAQSREQNAVRSNFIGDRLDAVGEEPGEQVAPAPQVSSGAGLGDELLHRADLHEQEGGLELLNGHSLPLATDFDA